MTSTTHDDRLMATPGERGGPGGPDELDEGDPDGPRRRRPRLFTAFVVIVGGLGVAAGAWYLSQALTKPAGLTPGELPLLVADNSPVKVRPEDPGGAEIPNRDKYVYKSLEGEQSEQPVEQLLPAPEEPMPKPVDTGPPLEPLANVTLDGMWAKPEASPPAAESAPPTEAPATIEHEGLAPPEQTAPEAGKPSADSSAQPVATVNVEAPAAPADQAAEIEAVAPTAGGVWIQVAALRDEASVPAEWKRLLKRYPGVLDNLQSRAERADLGAKGVWFRVQAGPFANREAAKAACQALAAQGGSCKVLTP